MLWAIERARSALGSLHAGLDAQKPKPKHAVQFGSLLTALLGLLAALDAFLDELRSDGDPSQDDDEADTPSQVPPRT